MIPPTRYARSGDLMVAYQVTGEENPIDLIWAPGVVSHLDLDWTFPAEVRLIERLSSFCRLIRFDKRGTGLSDRGITAATLEERSDDIRAVLDAVGSERAVIGGNSEGGCMALLFAATHPERCSEVVLWGTQARWVETDDYPWGFPPEVHARIVREFGEVGMTEEYLVGMGAGMPTLAGADLAVMIRYCQAAASPSQLAALERMNVEMDIRAILPTIRVPALVLHRSGDPVAPPAAVRALAEAIPGAQRKAFPGDDHVLAGNDLDEIVDVIEEFVTGRRPVRQLDRVLATVLFSDIVGSTTRAVELGDARWRSLLERHDELARREVERHRGSFVKSTGDGFLATFDGPARAVRCARSYADAVAALQLAVRCSCHTGEIELRGGDVAGLAVHVAARLLGHAAPGEVLTSRTVRELVAGSGLVFDDRGSRVLDGVPGEWQLFAAREG